MHFRPLLLLSCLAVCCVLSVRATGQDPDINFQARPIADQLRCPVCRGIPIADSPSELAQDMMETIREKLSQGLSEEEILLYFENRYGEWILMNPKPKGLNLTLWLLPASLLLGGAAFLVFKFSQWSKRSK